MPQQTDPEQELVDSILSFWNDPEGFVRFAFPWGEEGTDLERFPDGPDKWHIELFGKMTAHIMENHARRQRGQPMMPFHAAVKSGHGIGKSACVAWIIMWVMSVYPSARGVVTANTEEQLKTKTWVELGKWHEMAINSHWFKKTSKSLMLVDDEKMRIDSLPWSETNTEGFAGLHNAGSATLIVFDEASGIPEIIWEVASGAETDKDNEVFWFAFGNPTQNSGRFFECFNRFRHRWNPVTVDSREVRITNDELINQWIEDNGIDSDYVRVRVLGEFPNEGESQFIPMDIVNAAQDRTLPDDTGAGIALGVDIARFGSDATVIAVREGRKIIEMKSWRGLDTMEVAGRVSEYIEKFKPDAVFIDDAGLGGGVTDRLKQLKYHVMPVNAGRAADDKEHWGNKRTEMWARMRDWLPGADIPMDDELRSDLISPEYRFNAQNRIILEPKEEMKKRGLASPDKADAIALTFAYNTPSPDVRRKQGRRVQVADSDYEIFG